MSNRRRNVFVLLLVLGLLIASGVAIAARKTQLGLDLRGGVQLVFQGRRTPQADVTPDAMNRAVDIIRAGCDLLIGRSRRDVTSTPEDARHDAHWRPSLTGAGSNRTIHTPRPGCA